MIEIEGPDGVIYEFPEGTDEATMARAMAQVYGAPKPAQPVATPQEYMAARSRGEMPAPLAVTPERAAQQRSVDDTNNPVRYSNVLEQFGAGSTEGIASGLGFPVDAVTGLGMAARDLVGIDYKFPEMVGGGDWFARQLSPFTEGIPDPTGVGQRISRRVGQDVGSSVAMAPAGALSAGVRAAPMRSAAIEGVSSLGSGLAGGLASEAAPDSVITQIAASLAGGMAPAMAAQRLTGDATSAVMRNGIQDQRMRASDAYAEVRADQRVLPQDSVDDMALGISGRMDSERINPMLQPGSNAILDAILRESSGPMRIEDIENLRRITTSAMPATATPADRRLSGMMTDEITAYLDGLKDPVADALVDGRNAYRRASAATAVEDATTRARRRAARTGSGGNEINATRQNLSAMIENPRKARSFTADELSRMDDVVFGSTGQNIARRLSRFAPSSGGLSAMLGVGGALASPAVALPIMAVTEGAKALGERSTRKAIADLVQSLAPNRAVKPSDSGIRNVIAALLAARTTANSQEE